MTRFRVWFRRLLPRPAPPSAVVLWIGPFLWRDAPRAVFRYAGVDVDGFHVWDALFDAEFAGKDYLVHEGSSSRRNRVEIKFVSADQLAAAMTESLKDQVHVRPGRVCRGRE